MDNHPVKLIPLGLGFMYTPKHRPHPRDRRVDWLGAAAAGALVLLNLALTTSVSDSKRWKTPYIPASLVSSLLLFALFVWRQLDLDKKDGSDIVPPPLVPRRLFARGRGELLALYFSATFVWIGVDGGYLYDDVLLLSGWQSALRVAPSALAGSFSTFLVGLTLSKVPAKLLLVLGDLINACTGLAFGLRHIDTSYWQADLWGWLVCGFATDPTTAVGNVLISDLTAPEEQGVASALLLSFARFGATLGLSLFTIIREGVTTPAEDAARASLGQDDLGWADAQAAEFAGIQAAYWAGGASLVIAASVIALGMRDWSVVGKNQPVLDQAPYPETEVEKKPGPDSKSASIV